MKKKAFAGLVLAVFVVSVITAFAAYHHEGEKDSDNFLQVYPNLKNTKLDHCALCHTGGQIERSTGTMTMGSCQWCHNTYGYDGSGNIVDTLNQYGKDYLLNGRNAAAITAIDNMDSDGDGHTNKTEIDAVRFPGDAKDDPSKTTAPYKVYTKAQLESMPKHTQFLLMNTSRSGDFYARYTGVSMEYLLKDAGIMDSATKITVYAADGWSQDHPLQATGAAESYQIYGTYPAATYYYDAQATAWCDYSSPYCAGRSHGDPITNSNGLLALLAYQRDGAYLDTGILGADNKLDGEGPFRVVVPQNIIGPPDQSSRSDDQNVIWPYNENGVDHNAGACSRTVTFIKVEPLPEGTTDIDVYEEGWQYVDEQKIVVYGAITGKSAITEGYLVSNKLWIRAVINTVEKGAIEAVWKKGDEQTTAAGDTVIWGHFYASPDSVTWGNAGNPDVFVKIWFDHSGRIDVNFFHVSVPDIEVYSQYPYEGAGKKQGTTTMTNRYIRHEYSR